MSIQTTLETGIGTVDIWHRLALGVECRDALTDRLVRSQVRVGRETAAPARSRRSSSPDWTPDWPCQSLEASGVGRFKLRLPVGGRLPATLSLRFDDPTRCYAPRRVTVHPWPAASLGDTPPYVPVSSRLLRIWLWPAAAYALPSGGTTVRGRVLKAGNPLRWARLTAIGPLNTISGRAHSDDRGEFVLVVTDPAQNPIQDTVGLTPVVRAPSVAPAVDRLDRLADLVVEDIPRSANPATAAELDNDVLRGIAVPPGYTPNTAALPALTVPIGAAHTLTEDIVFT